MKHNKHFFFGLFLVLWILCACQANNTESLADENLQDDHIEIQEQIVIEVPLGDSPVIDGVIEPDEWTNALIKTFSDNSELLVLSDSEYLYLGIREQTGEMIAVNIFINQGKEISILHSSAALGTAAYLQQDNSWKKTRDFEWCCRQTNSSNQAIKDLEDQLETEYWVASNSRRGAPNEVEYQIKITADELNIAVSFLLASDPNHKTPWPADLDDDCIMLTPGGFPDEMVFDPGRWGLLYIDFYDEN